MNARAFKPIGRKPGSVRHKADQELKNAIFVGRESEMAVLRQGLNQMMKEKKVALTF